MIDKALTAFMWGWIGLLVLILGFTGVAMVVFYREGVEWYWWLYWIFLGSPMSIIPQSPADLVARIMLISPAIGAYFWREHRRQKAK
jgi:hypothetical protein